ncbi:MAG: carboxylating nicotinate-nucleotide diphosphorylase [Bacteroidota bacterium]
MVHEYLTPAVIQNFIVAALQEDIGSGDHSTLSSIPENAKGRAKLLVKANGILAGAELAAAIFKHFDPELHITSLVEDGDAIKYGDIAFTVEGNSRSILSTERLVLNTMQRMSGIATYTRHLVEQIEGTGARLLDTRKTTPGFRFAEKWAVKIGGGTNHRFGLSDMVMLKDNHVDFAGGVAEAVSAAKKYLADKKLNLQIEVETRNLNEVAQALAAKPDRIMLDNMKPEMMREAVAIINGACETEASGGITEKNIREAALTGVTYISVGALTHSARSLDLSLKAY